MFRARVEEGLKNIEGKVRGRRNSMDLGPSWRQQADVALRRMALHDPRRFAKLRRALLLQRGCQELCIRCRKNCVVLGSSSMYESTFVCFDFVERKGKE